MSLKFWLPVGIILFGMVVLVFFFKTRPKAMKEDKPFLGSLVEVKKLEASDHKIMIQTYGVVRSKERIILSPQIAGVIDFIKPQFVAGGFFKKDELILTLNPVSTANLNYTILKAPFNAVIQAKNVDIGQYVAPGTQLGILIGSDQAEVHVNLPMDQLALLPIKGSQNHLNLPATVTLSYGDSKQSWNALAVRYLLELTTKGMMVQLILEVDNPFQIKSTNHPSPSPLFIGAFVEVLIPGKQLTNVYMIPAHALRHRNTVWIASQNVLEIRPVEVAHIDKNKVFLSKGVNSGELIITSPLKGAAEGLKIRYATSPIIEDLSKLKKEVPHDES